MVLQFYDTSERITDFQAAEEGHAELDEDGVAVVWDEEDDDEDDSVVDEIDDSDVSAAICCHSTPSSMS